MRVAFTVTGDGCSSVDVKYLDDGGVETIIPGMPPVRYTGLSWSAEGILASRFDGLSRDIVLIDPADGEEEVLVGTKADERDPMWAPGGGGFFYSSDRSGIFNLYYRDMAAGTILQVSDVEGGAFQPVGNGGDILFVAFGRKGYEIRLLDHWRLSASEPDPYVDERLIADRDASKAKLP
jgi:hypothetical protein